MVMRLSDASLVGDEMGRDLNGVSSPHALLHAPFRRPAIGSIR